MKIKGRSLYCSLDLFNHPHLAENTVPARQFKYSSLVENLSTQRLQYSNNKSKPRLCVIKINKKCVRDTPAGSDASIEFNCHLIFWNAWNLREFKRFKRFFKTYRRRLRAPGGVSAHLSSIRDIQDVLRVPENHIHIPVGRARPRNHYFGALSNCLKFQKN